jgi:tRNA splicing ligase
MSEDWSPEQYQNYFRKKEGSDSAKPKYGNIKTKVQSEEGELMFDSQAEATHYSKLLLLKRQGEVTLIETQVSYNLYVNEVKICQYRADFRVTYSDGRVEVQDVKGQRKKTDMATQIFRIKQALMKACYGIDVKVITK